MNNGNGKELLAVAAVSFGLLASAIAAWYVWDSRDWFLGLAIAAACVCQVGCVVAGRPGS
jgi:hypothetical protein